MCLDEPPQVLLRPLGAVLALIRIRAELAVVAGILPRLPRERLDGGVERREHGRVHLGVIEAGLDARDVAREAGEDVDALVARHHVGKDDLALRRGVLVAGGGHEGLLGGVGAGSEDTGG